MIQPTFSICIPNYNYAQYIGETIQSVLGQTYQNFEIIISDNASTDNSVEAIRSFKDNRIHLIRNRYNIGFTPNLQQATRDAKNDFMLLLSSDDRMLPDALEVYAEVIATQGNEAHNTVIYSEANQIDDQGTTTPNPVYQFPFYERLQAIEKKIAIWTFLPSLSGQRRSRKSGSQAGACGAISNNGISQGFV